MNYIVIAGNHGKVHSGADEKAARAAFSEYVRKSERPRSSVEGQDIVLMGDGQAIAEHAGRFDSCLA